MLKSRGIPSLSPARRHLVPQPRGATALTASCSKLSARSGQADVAVLPYWSMRWLI